MSAANAHPSDDRQAGSVIGAISLNGAVKEAIVHIIDDDDEFLAALQLQLQSFGLTVEPYFSAEHFLVTYRPRSIECIVLDLRMPSMTGLELQTVMRQRHFCPPVVVLSASSRTSDIVQAVQNGAINYLVKPVDEQVLISQVRAALNRDQDNKRGLGLISQRLARLSEREREVMDLFLRAKTTIALAHILKISPKTVESHRAKIFEKMEVDSIPELIRSVLNLGDEVSHSDVDSLPYSPITVS